MGALQKTIAEILSRLRDISASQRLVLVLGGALIAVSLLWLAHWAASPEYVPLLEESLSPEELASVRSGLDSMGQEYEQRGNQVFVPASTNMRAVIAQLQQQEQLPNNTSSSFAALVEKSDPWISQAENTRRWAFALQKELERTLEWMDGVSKARVFLNLSEGRRAISRVAPRSSAGVTLIMKNGDRVPRPLALSAARLVSGAVAGLQMRDVEVVDGSGALALDWEQEGDPANTLERLRRQHEQEYTERIRRLIPDPDVLVSVVVELVSTTSRTDSETPIDGVIRQEETTNERLTRGNTSNQPGVQPNVGVAAGSGGMTESSEKDTVRSEFQTGLARRSESTPAGGIQRVAAAIRLSSSYLDAVYRRANPDADPPTDKELETIFEAERRRVVGQVARLVKPEGEDNVAVEWYWDTALAPDAMGPTGTLDVSLDVAKRYGPQSGLALLALIALGMMLRMAKKPDSGDSFGLELGLPKEAIDAARAAAADVGVVAGRRSRSSSRAHVAGGGGDGIETIDSTEVEQASATEGMLVAQEVDASTVQTRKMLDQVSEMTQSDPETISDLVEQWVQRNEGYREE